MTHRSEAYERDANAPARATQGAVRERPSFRRSLRWRLPFVFGALAVLMLVTFLAMTYRTVEGTLVRAGEVRAGEGAAQLAAMLGRSLQGQLEDADSLRSSPELRAFLLDPNVASRAAVEEDFTPSSPFRRVEIWTADGTLLYEQATPSDDTLSAPVSQPRGEPPAAEGVSPIMAVEGRNYLHITTAIRAGDSAGSAVIGYIRRFGNLSSSSADAIRGLLGDDATFRIGSANGAWTDFADIVEPPPLADPAAEADDVGRSDRRWVGAAANIAGTPWQAWVGFPRSLIVAPARPFMERLLLLALLLVAGGMALFALLGARLTRPLRELAAAAGEIAAGDLSRRVDNGRTDEIGQLSHAFNRMTDRIQDAYGALKESHEKTQFALAAARIGVWDVRLDTGRVACSESMALVHGVTEDALPHTREAFLELIHPEDRQHVSSLLEGDVEGDGAFDLRCRAVWPDGSIHLIEGKGRVKLDAGGRPVSVLGVSMDATERRRLEMQLRQAQKMEAIGQLAGGVAHDFNNLLTAIVAHGSLVLEELPEQGRAREDVIEILKAGESAAGLTRQLLTFSRRQVVQPQTIDVNAVISNTERLLRRLIGADIAFATSLAPDLEPVTIDPGQLEQVIVNLAVNARDAMPEGGRLGIRTSNTDLEETLTQYGSDVEAGRYIMISVSDTGVGMDAETQAHLFEPFFTTKPAGKGTGLGLATVFGIVKGAGGHIHVYTELGIGTTFKVYLPASIEKSAASPVKARAPKLVGGKETILLVEDSTPVRAIARTILERIGYRVVVAGNGEEALQVLASTDTRPDLVVSDVVMPGMTGPELCRRLEERYPGIRVLFTSGYSGDALGRHGIDESGALFIEKPYTPVELANKVREALSVGFAG